MTRLASSNSGKTLDDIWDLIYGAGFLAIGLVGWHRLRSAQDDRRFQAGMRAVETATVGVADATSEVRATIEAMAKETDRAQRLALWVAVGTTLVGAIVGGFAGAFAAQIIGG